MDAKQLNDCSILILWRRMIVVDFLIKMISAFKNRSWLKYAEYTDPFPFK